MALYAADDNPRGENLDAMVMMDVVKLGDASGRLCSSLRDSAEDAALAPSPHPPHVHPCRSPRLNASCFLG
jgi:hypothetical protein